MDSQAQLGEFEPTAAGAVVGLLLVFASIALLPLGRALALRLVPDRNVFFARWGFFHVGLAIFTYFALTILGAAALRAVGVELSDGLAPVLFGAGLQLATVAVCLAFARRLDPDGIASLGLRSGKNVRSLGVGVLAYALGVPAIVGAMLLSAWSWKALGIDAPPQDVLELVLELQGAERWIFALLAVALIPLCEELFFRGFLQPLLVQNLGDRLGVLATALLFAAVHGNLVAFLPIFVLALLLGMVMLRTGRIGAAWLVHALHNGITIALVLGSDWARRMLEG
ncbi:MAG: CPBP family intramembrane metalloprotease [Planctomycetes bacterium]|nr:CPBP family intramembrane metalloprotease [Planctomycetota bacterium]